MILKIGLTGGIGSGKSYIGKVFKALGVPLYEADKEAKRLMQTDMELKKQIINLLSTDAYQNGTLNRSHIASLVFNNRTLLNELNHLVHPVVQRDFLKWSENIITNSTYVLEEAALLFESGSANKMNYNIFVDASRKTRLERIMKRDQLTEVEVNQRMESQMDPESKKTLSDFVINNEDNEPILKQILDLHNHISKLKE